MKLSLDLISNMIPVLKLSDTGAKGLALMEVFKVSHLPVVENGKFVGLISESDILDRNSPTLPLSEYELSVEDTSILTNVPLFEVVSFSSGKALSVIPVVDNQLTYMGSISTTELVTRITDTSSFLVPGAIVVLTMGANDYSLSQIAQIVESNNAKVLYTYILNVTDSSNIEVVIKLNTSDITSILETFSRYSYSVTNIYNATDENTDMMDDRYNQLMKYLNL